MPAKTTKAKPAKKAPKYSVEIEINGETHKFTADNLFEGIREWEKPPVVKTDLVVRVKAGGKVAEAIVGVMKARRAFHNKTALELLVVNLERRLG